MADLRRMHPDDHPAIAHALSTWWDDDGNGSSTPEGAAHRRDIVPRLWCDHFWPTSTSAYAGDDLVGFLIGIHSPGRPEEAYAHFVGVRPDQRRGGLGQALYRRFAEEVRAAGRHTIRAITSEENTASVAFHRSLGFEVSGPDPDYETLQPPRWRFTWRLER